jgi:hypothetical protein
MKMRKKQQRRSKSVRSFWGWSMYILDLVHDVWFDDAEVL